MVFLNSRTYQKALGLLCLLFLISLRAGAQLSPSEPDPLARIRDAAKDNVMACSATGETLCEQVAPKIIANAEGDSPLAENVRRLALDLDLGRLSGRDDVAARVAAMFRAAGLEARVEENPIPGGGEVQNAVVAEVRGREKPEEWVLLGTSLQLNGRDTTRNPDVRGWIRMSCNAALVVEAARDVQATGIKARRSIRFVILVSSESYLDYLNEGSWPYVRAHRDEMERARAAIDFPGVGRFGVYELGGRHDIEAGLREAIKPLDSWEIPFSVDGNKSVIGDQFDFMIEGVPTITANQRYRLIKPGPVNFSAKLNQVDVPELKRNTAVAAVTAFGIAERAEPIGPRQSREQIETLLKSIGVGGTRLDDQMKAAGIWPQWESGQRGRQP